MFTDFMVDCMRRKIFWMVGCGFMAAFTGCGSKGKGNTGGNQQPPGDMAMCFMAPDDSAFAPQRAACSFAAAATPADTLGVTEALRGRLPIKHVIVLMKENRSYDHIFGQLAAHGQPDSEPVPSTFSNLDANDMTVAPFHEPTTCVHYDPHHQWADMHAQVDGGKMDGFVTNAQAHNDPDPGQPPSDGHFVMGYYDNSDLPFYYWLASTFALADHHFASVRSGTWANRDFLVAGTSDGIQDTEERTLSGVPLIFDKLTDAKVSWQVYTDDGAPLEYSVDWGGRPHWGSTKDFFAALADGSLPAVSFIDANTGVLPSVYGPETDEHPTADVQLGESWTRDLVTKLVASPVWSSSVLFYTYDEAGGFADHVPPGNSCAPSAKDSTFTELGVRVPLVAISPFAKRKFVSHAVHQHTSILRFIETVYGIPALTARDANSDALLDLFDFCNPQMEMETPPAAGTGGCK
jgi:phospholipase C